MQTTFAEGLNVSCIKGGENPSIRNRALPAVCFSYGYSKCALP